MKSNYKNEQGKQQIAIVILLYLENVLWEASDALIVDLCRHFLARFPNSTRKMVSSRLITYELQFLLHLSDLHDDNSKFPSDPHFTLFERVLHE